MIPPDVLRELRYLEISTRRGSVRPAGAVHESGPRRRIRIRPASPYQPGDDVRRIDWNVTARLNTPYLRETHAERELNVILAIDLSRSMSVGSSHSSKKEAVTFITASLLFPQPVTTSTPDSWGSRTAC